MTNNQEWFNKEFPKNSEEIEIEYDDFYGQLIIEDYPNLREINISDITCISNLNLKNCHSLEKIRFYNCELETLTIINCPNINSIDVCNNNLKNLSFLENLSNLKTLKIDSNKKISFGIKYLPLSLEEFSFESTRLTTILKKYDNDWKFYQAKLLENPEQNYQEKYNELKISLKEILIPLIKNSESINTEEVIERFYQNPATKEMVSRLRADSEDLISENKSLKIENEEFKPLFDDQEPKLGDKELGSGGFGSVYLGKWKTQSVAVKKPFSVKSDEDLNKIKEELKLLKNLRSKYTIQYYGEYHKKETNDFFIIMEYAENGSLENFVRKSPYLNLDSSIRMVREIVWGLSYIHSEKVVHRDLRTANILLTKEGVIKISDFGLSKFNQSNLLNNNQKKSFARTLYWMAPELLVKDNNNFNPFQSDIYSLGMVIYELLVRLEPFDDYDYSEERLIEEIVENNARPSFNDGFLSSEPLECLEKNFEGFLVPKFLENLINKCWDKDPRKRLNCSEIDNYLEENRSTRNKRNR